MNTAWCGLGLLLAFGTVERAAADALLDQPWREYTSAHFRLVTDLPPSEARQRLYDLEQFRVVVRAVTGVTADEAPVSTRVYLFARNRDFEWLFGSRYAGFFGTRLRSNHLVANGSALALGQRSILYHEYVHFLVNQNSTEHYPEWYHEGLAEMLSTVHEADGEVVFGKPPQRLGALWGSQLPLATVLHGNTRDLRPHHVNQFYARAWSLVHYLHTGHLAGGEMRLPQLFAYLALLNEGATSEEAFAEAFDISEAQLASEIRRYLARGRKPVLTQPASSFAVDLQVSSRDLTTRQVAYELGHLALDANHEAARLLFEALVEMSPQDPRALASLAESYRRAGEFARGARYGRRAVDASQDDAEPRRLVGDLLFAWCAAGEPPSHCELLLDEARSLYQAGLDLAPDDPKLRYGLAVTMLTQGDSIERAYRMLAEITETRQWHPGLNYEAGVAALKAEDLEAAEWYLRRARSFTHSQRLRAQSQTLLEELEAMRRSHSNTPRTSAAP